MRDDTPAQAGGRLRAAVGSLRPPAVLDEDVERTQPIAELSLGDGVLTLGTTPTSTPMTSAT